MANVVAINACQADVLAFLLDPATHGWPARGVSHIETNLSVIVLAGNLAFKLKRAVHLPYVDFSSYAMRLRACQRELELNRRTAPMIYRAVRRITREADGRLGFDGAGEGIDAVVEMLRFNEDAELERMAERGELPTSVLAELGREIARFHDSAELVYRNDGSMSDVIDINLASFKTTNFFAPDIVAKFDEGCRRHNERHLALLSRRAQGGSVRHCHGDLHLRNICLMDGRPVLFDCIEFNDRLATIDVLYDLAFLLTDLWRLGLRAQANLVMNRYLDARDDEAGLPLLPLFMALRAGIRAHVLASHISSTLSRSSETESREAQSYMSLALQLLEPASAYVVAISGKSGTGKSTIAAALADRIGPVPGARILSSDRIRKRLSGVADETRLPAAAYAPDVSEHVYAYQAEHATLLAANGAGVVADAVFERPADRQRIERAAKEAHARFSAIRLHAPVATLIDRVRARKGGPSDADAAVVRMQDREESGRNDWTEVDSSGTPEEVCHRVAQAIEGV